MYGGSTMVTPMTDDALPARGSAYEEMALSELLFRYLWPFWLFQDASSGDRLARAAAYRHNRGMRIYLPGYLLKWFINSSVAFLLTDRLAAAARQFSDSANLFTVMAAGAGVLFVCCMCVLFLTAYIYCYLSRNEG
jgi:hypothetical protein